MSKLTKNQKSVAEKIEAGKAYTLREAMDLVKEITTTKFEASVDIDVRLGVDPRKANQMVRGVVSLPNGTGKVTRVRPTRWFAALCRCLTELVRLRVCSHCVLPIRRLLQRKLALIMLVLTNM